VRTPFPLPSRPLVLYTSLLFPHPLKAVKIFSDRNEKSRRRGRLGAAKRNPTLNLFIYPKYCVGFRRTLGLGIQNQNYRASPPNLP
jgi:hypothetical protein